jgi:hypothetical protein
MATAQQLEPFGLEDKTVTAMHFYGGSLYAATENDGVYRRFGRAGCRLVHLEVPAKNSLNFYFSHGLPA